MSVPHGFLFLSVAAVWGGKGQGKTFQTELIFKALGIEPIIMSAGEMESEWAGFASDFTVSYASFDSSGTKLLL
jgi:hypothetical protein